MNPSDNFRSAPSGPPAQIADHNGQDRTQPCSTCRELIIRGAKKCTHCESYQDWRLHLTASTAVLALIVSSLAGLTAAGPMVYQAWRKSDSKMSIASVSLPTYGHINVLMKNSGKKPGTASIMTIDLPIKGDRKTIWLHLNQTDPNAGLVPADGVREMVFAGDFRHRTDGAPHAWDPLQLTQSDLVKLENSMDDIEKGEGLPKCEVGIKVTSFKGKPTNITKNLDCRELKDMLRIYWEDAQHQG